MKKIVRIKWISGIETIDVSLSEHVASNEIIETEEYWPESEESVKYYTTSTRKRLPNGSQLIKIRYAKDKNPKLVEVYGEDSLQWGVSTIEFSPDLNSAKARWDDDEKDSEYTGDAPACYVYSEDLFEEMERVATLKIKKKQSEFKKTLLDMYKCCAITGESTPEVLDAAHIVDAFNNGSTSIFNGILLRTDLHRLYDANAFSILPNGELKLNTELSDYYNNLLESAKIDSKIISRITQALEQRFSLREDSW